MGSLTNLVDGTFDELTFPRVQVAGAMEGEGPAPFRRRGFLERCNEGGKLSSVLGIVAHKFQQVGELFRNRAHSAGEEEGHRSNVELPPPNRRWGDNGGGGDASWRHRCSSSVNLVHSCEARHREGSSCCRSARFWRRIGMMPILVLALLASASGTCSALRRKSLSGCCRSFCAQHRYSPFSLLVVLMRAPLQGKCSRRWT